MASATVGKLGAFDPMVESVVAHLEWVELFFKANKVANDSKIAVFLTVLRASKYALLRNLLAPEKVADEPLDMLTEALRNHYEQT